MAFKVTTHETLTWYQEEKVFKGIEEDDGVGLGAIGVFLLYYTLVKRWFEYIHKYTYSDHLHPNVDVDC